MEKEKQSLLLRQQWNQDDDDTIAGSPPYHAQFYRHMSSSWMPLLLGTVLGICLGTLITLSLTKSRATLHLTPRPYCMCPHDEALRVT